VGDGGVMEGVDGDDVSSQSFELLGGSPTLYHDKQTNTVAIIV